MLHSCFALAGGITVPSRGAPRLCDDFLQEEAFFEIEELGILGETQEHAQYIELHADPFQMRELLGFRELAREQDAFQHVEDQVLRPLPDGITILFLLSHRWNVAWIRSKRAFLRKSFLFGAGYPFDSSFASLTRRSG